MSDDRLFASNHAIGRKWYYINIFILCILTLITKYVFENFLIPNIINDFFISFANYTLYFIYFIYLITFFSLIERRLYDISGSRESSVYKNISAIMGFTIFLQISVIIIPYTSIKSYISPDLLLPITYIFDFIFLIITFILGLIKGQISNLSFKEFRRRNQYKI